MWAEYRLQKEKKRKKRQPEAAQSLARTAMGGLRRAGVPIRGGGVLGLRWVERASSPFSVRLRVGGDEEEEKSGTAEIRAEETNRCGELKKKRKAGDGELGNLY